MSLIFSFLTSNLKVTILEDTELVSVATTLKSDDPNGASWNTGNDQLHQISENRKKTKGDDS